MRAGGLILILFARGGGYAGPAVERRGRDAGAVVWLPVEGIREDHDGVRGTSTGTGPGYLEDTAGTWFAGQYAGFELVVSSGTVRTLTGSA